VVIGLMVLTAFALLTRWAAIFTESINWDEFALLARADVAVHGGPVLGAGRPGLVTLLLVPFVRGCVDSVATVVTARVVWLLITVAYVGGVIAIVRRWFRFAARPEDGTFEAIACAALLALMPAFVAWSVQVRTDQAALAAAVWGGYFLMSRGRVGAALSVALFGLAILCSQKGLYIIGLCGLLWASATLGQLNSPGGTTRRRAALAAVTRLAGVALAAGAVLAIYAQFVPAAAALVGKSALAGSWDVMNTYRSHLGYRVYAAEIRLVPLHCMIFLALAAMTVRAIVRRDRAELSLFATCWAVLLLGLLVVLVHGSNFRYFLMTAGLFPAVALGMASGQVVRQLRQSRTPVILASMLALALGSMPTTLQLLNGDQRVQAETMQWINSSGLRRFRGYQVEGALFCSGDPDPIRVMFSQQIARASKSSPEVFDELLEEFRRRPIAYIVDSYRMSEFPAKVREFWDQHFLPYFGAVSITGFRIPPGRRDQQVDVLVAGHYRWIPSGRFPQAMLRVGDRSIAAGSVAWLRAGRQSVAAIPVDAWGQLLLAVESPPRAEIAAFYDDRQLESLVGVD
jgi:hypothetical protein